MRLSFINLIWIVFNFPIVYLVITLYVAKDLESLLTLGISIVVLIPFILFPSTLAMFAEMRKIIMKQNNSSTIKSFWKSYRENYKTSVLCGSLLLIVWIIFVIDYYYFVFQVNELFKYVFFFLLIYLVAFTLHVISYNIHFKTKLINSFKKVVFITFGYPFLSFGIAIFTFLLVYISFNVYTFFILFFMGSLISLVSFSSFYWLYIKVVTKSQ
ncbi:YesL family protein [Aquibacillus albus]